MEIKKRMGAKTQALISAMFWGVDPYLTHSYSRGWKSTKNGVFFLSFIKEFISFILVGLIFNRRIKLKEVTKKNKIKLAFAGIFGGGISLSLYISSMAILGFGLSDLLISLYPIVVLVLSRVIFKEKITSSSILAILFIVAGAILVSLGAKGKINANLGIILAISGAVSYGLEALIIKSIDQPDLNVGSMLFIKYFASSLSLFLIILISSFIPGMLPLWKLADVTLKLELLFVLLAGANAIASYVFYYWALQKTSNPSIIVAINSSYILFAMIISWIVKDSEPNAWNISGTILIFIGLIFTGVTLPKFKKKNKIKTQS